MLNQQKQDQEAILRNIAAELSNDIRGERLRFVEAMKEATAINVQGASILSFNVIETYSTRTHSSRRAIQARARQGSHDNDVRGRASATGTASARTANRGPLRFLRKATIGDGEFDLPFPDR